MRSHIEKIENLEITLIIAEFARYDALRREVYRLKGKTESYIKQMEEIKRTARLSKE